MEVEIIEVNYNEINNMNEAKYRIIATHGELSVKDRYNKWFMYINKLMSDYLSSYLSKKTGEEIEAYVELQPRVIIRTK